jgi:hypothetical protein
LELPVEHYSWYVFFVFFEIFKKFSRLKPEADCSFQLKFSGNDQAQESSSETLLQSEPFPLYTLRVIVGIRLD